MEYDGSEHRGQQELGCVAITVILTSFSLAWIWSMYIPSGRGGKGLLSIRTSFLCQHRFTRSREVQCIIPASLPPTPSIPRFTKVGQEPSSDHIYISGYLLPDTGYFAFVFHVCGSSQKFTAKRHESLTVLQALLWLWKTGAEKDRHG